MLPERIQAPMEVAENSHSRSQSGTADSFLRDDIARRWAARSGWKADMYVVAVAAGLGRPRPSRRNFGHASNMALGLLFLCGVAAAERTTSVVEGRLNTGTTLHDVRIVHGDIKP